MENEIKKECEFLYNRIKESELRLKEIRSTCPHKETFEGNYSYRIGAISLAEICSDCGALIRYK